MPTGDRLFDTWEGDSSDILDDLSHVTTKHELPEELAPLLEGVVRAYLAADGNTSQFMTDMWVIHKTHTPKKDYQYGPDRHRRTARTS